MLDWKTGSQWDPSPHPPAHSQAVAVQAAFPSSWRLGVSSAESASPPHPSVFTHLAPVHNFTFHSKCHFPRQGFAECLQLSKLRILPSPEICI